MEDRYLNPFRIDDQGEARALRRIPRDTPPFEDGGKKGEGGLQELLRRYPEILPVEDTRFLPLIPIGRETDLGQGCSLDNLYISPEGYLTLVEAKLWKNPQARREVVGQIIEYAKRLSSWSFENLDKACQQYTRKYEGQEKCLWDWVQEKKPLEDEERFIDTANRAMAAGEFKLLIVGEGITQRAEELVEVLNRAPQLGFALELVELICYYLEEQDSFPYLVVPRVVARTREIQRAIVTISPVPEEMKGRVRVEVTLPQQKAGKPGPRPPTLTEGDFYRKLTEVVGPELVGKVRQFADEVKDELNMVVDFGVNNLKLRFGNPKGPGVRTALNISAGGLLGRSGEIVAKLEDWRLPIPAAEELVERFVRTMNSVHSGFHMKKNDKGLYRYPSVPLKDVADKLPDIKEALRKLVEDLEKAASE